MKIESPLKKLEKFIFTKVEMWIVLLIAIGGLILSLFFGAGVRHYHLGNQKLGAIGETFEQIASFPSKVRTILTTPAEIIQQGLITQHLAFTEFTGLKIVNEDKLQNDYILTSAYNSKYGISTAYLYDIGNRTIVHEWVPPLDLINEKAPTSEIIPEKINYRTQHPLLMGDGDIIFTSGDGALVRIGQCSDIKWVIDRQFHHSINIGSDDNLYVPIVVKNKTINNPIYGTDMKSIPLRNDGFAQVTTSGKILREWSIQDILIANGYSNMLYTIGAYEEDRFHINDVQPILSSDNYVKEGDLAISMRHLSTVLLYRPSTNKVLWIQTGPWLNQHDIDYQGNGVFTIFGNDLVRGFGPVRGYSTIWKYNMDNNSAEEFLPLKEIYTETEGLHQILDNGNIFIEEENKGILHLVNSRGETIWKYASSDGENTISLPHWSRYMKRSQVNINNIFTEKCARSIQ